MPYCSQCGNQVRDVDAFCTKCGARQPLPQPNPIESASGAVSDRASCVLCYTPFIGWVVAIIVLASARFREHRVVRFHAFQGLYLFVAWLLADRVLGPVLRLSLFPIFWDNGFSWGERAGWMGLIGLVELFLVVVGIFMMFKADDSNAEKLPVLGDLAEKSL